MFEYVIPVCFFVIICIYIECKMNSLTSHILTVSHNISKTCKLITQDNYAHVIVLKNDISEMFKELRAGLNVEKAEVATEQVNFDDVQFVEDVSKFIVKLETEYDMEKDRDVRAYLRSIKKYLESKENKENKEK